MADPTPPAVTCCLATVTLVTGAASANAVTFDGSATAWHALAAATYAVFDTTVAAQTVPTVPVIVNVSAVFGAKMNPLRLHAKSVPLAVPVTLAAAQPPGCAAT